MQCNDGVPCSIMTVFLVIYCDSAYSMLKLYDTCILPIFYTALGCWAVSQRDVLKIDALVIGACESC